MQLQIVEKYVLHKSMYMQKIWFKMCSDVANVEVKFVKIMKR